MNFKIAQKLSPEHFKRRFGVQRATFKHLVKVLKPLWRATAKPGVKPKLVLADRILVCLEYWREYRTYFHIGSSWGVSESTVCRIVNWVENNLLQCGQFRLAGKKQLVQGFGKPQVVVMDVTESPIERVPSAVNASSTQAKRNDTPSSVRLCLTRAVGALFARFLAKGDGMTSSSIKLLEYALLLKPKAYRTKGIKASRSCTPTFVYLTRNPVEDN